MTDDGDSKPIWTDPGRFVAVWASRDALPATIGSWRPLADSDARFIHYPLVEDLIDHYAIEVLDGGVGLLEDKKYGGVLVVAPAAIEPGDHIEDDDDRLVYDLQLRMWRDANGVADPRGRAMGWAGPRPGGGA